MANYYILLPYTEDLQKVICRRTQELIAQKIKSIYELRRLNNQGTIAEENLKNAINHLLKVNKEVTIKMLLAKGFSTKTISSYITDIARELNLEVITKAHNEKYFIRRI